MKRKNPEIINGMPANEYKKQWYYKNIDKIKDQIAQRSLKRRLNKELNNPTGKVTIIEIRNEQEAHKLYLKLREDFDEYNKIQ